MFIFTQTELALWGSGAFKAGGTAAAFASSLAESFCPRTWATATLRKLTPLWLQNGGPPFWFVN